MFKTKSKKHNGFTLVEISLAVFILGIGVCGILSVFPVAMQWGGEAMTSCSGSAAALAAVEKLEDVYLSASIGSLPQDILLIVDVSKSNPDEVEEGGYICRMHIPDSPQPYASLNSYYVTLDIYRNGYAVGKKADFSTKTLFYDRP